MDTRPAQSPESPAGPVPKAVVNRLSLYLRELQRLIDAGQQTISSSQLGHLLGCTDAQVRKDLAWFGQFGYPGIGYRCDELVVQIRRILGTDKSWRVVLIGAGNLGHALLRYRGFHQQGFEIVAAFDTSEKKVDQTLEGIPVFHLDRLDEIVAQHQIRLGIIAVPAAFAQGVADRLVTAGISGILNFAPVTISVPDEIHLVGVDLTVELEQLSFAVVNSAEKT